MIKKDPFLMMMKMETVTEWLRTLVDHAWNQLVPLLRHVSFFVLTFNLSIRAGWELRICWILACTFSSCCCNLRSSSLLDSKSNSGYGGMSSLSGWQCMQNKKLTSSGFGSSIFFHTDSGSSYLTDRQQIWREVKSFFQTYISLFFKTLCLSSSRDNLPMIQTEKFRWPRNKKIILIIHTSCIHNTIVFTLYMWPLYFWILFANYFGVDMEAREF